MTIHQISKKQKEQLQLVTPSKDGTIEYSPCQVILNIGSSFDNVYLVEYNSYLKVWGIMPDAVRQRNMCKSKR